MTNKTLKSVWQTLSAADLVKGELPVMEFPESPWYVKVLLAFSGWLAALFLLGFLAVGLEFLIENAIASLVTGCAMIAIAFAILNSPKNEFVEHLGLAVSLAGQLLVLNAIFELVDSYKGIAWFYAALVQVILTVLMPNTVHRIFSAYLVVFSLSISVMTSMIGSSGAVSLLTGVSMFGVAFLWLNEFKYIEHMQKIRAIGYGLILGLIHLKGVGAFGLQNVDWPYADDPEMFSLPFWIGELVACLALLYCTRALLLRLNYKMTDSVAYAAFASVVVLGIVSVEAQGITLGVLILVLGFANSNRVLMGLGVLSLLSYLSFYYYFMDVSLLYKSFILGGLGLVLLAIRHGINSKFGSNPAQEGAAND
ncbi:DUF4401 domain-containing protein [Litoribacillus peritrichatus]|uniref:DUF4401 domain-containing protein n=1 Tax=Litoribacillus peritrichatus TaxID=718191 RepID=A0ABP7M7G9_9GAMM